MKKQIKVFLLMVMAMVAFSGTAMATGVVPNPPDFAELTKATDGIPGDWSMRIWRYAFGDFAKNPLTAIGLPDTLLGAIFLVFNSCVFILGGIWATYGITSAIVSSAHEGEVLGQRMSTVWFPIRVTTGIAGMMPVLGGFSIQQGIMMFLTVVGIGIGNTTMIGAINNANMFNALVTEDNFSPEVRSKIRGMTKTMFLNNICVIQQSADDQSMGEMRNGNEMTKMFFHEERPGVKVLKYGSVSNPTMCGMVRLDMNEMNRSSSSMTGFRVQSVDYENIAKVSQQAHEKAMTLANEKTGRVAAKWLNDRAQALSQGAPTPAYPEQELEAIYMSISRDVRQEMFKYKQEEGAHSGAFRKQAADNMKALGWMGLGAWYGTFAEHNAALADAAQGPEVTYATPMDATNGLTTLAESTVESLTAAVARETERRTEAKSTGRDKEILSETIEDFCVDENFLTKTAGVVSNPGTATGNCSLGQSLVIAAIGTDTIARTGGGEFINPIITMKNLGDGVVAFTSTVVSLKMVSSAVENFIPQGKLASIMGKAAWLDKLNPVSKGNDKGGSGVMNVMAVALMMAGAFMSFYIPFIPFVVWMGAIIAYVGSVFEGMVGSQLHAFSHLDTQGDGLGQRTGHGYLFFINVLFRPALMVIAFFIASFMLIAIGTLQVHLFAPALANVQGNSLTGLLSILGFLIVFAVMNVTLINASFGMINILTDQVIGFVGNAINTRLGQDTEGRVSNTFMTAARFAPDQIQRHMRSPSWGTSSQGAVATDTAAGAGRAAGAVGGGAGVLSRGPSSQT